MELMYSNDSIEIKYEEKLKLLVGNWKDCTSSVDYMSGIKSFREMFDKVRPKNTLWDIRDFQYSISPDMQKWTDESLNIPAVNAGFRGKVSLVTGRNMQSMGVVKELFDESKTDMPLRFFEHEAQALSWVTKPRNLPAPVPTPLVKVKDLASGKLELSLEIEREDFHEYIVLFNQLRKSRQFSVLHAQNFYSLTAREKNILQQVIKGYSNLEISDQLFISIETVKTHRKNIISKLKCNSVLDLASYQIFF